MVRALLFLEAYLHLLWAGRQLKRRGFQAVAVAVTANPPAARANAQLDRIIRIAMAAKVAARWLPMRAACLEISLATYMMAKRRRIPVRLHVGVRQNPFVAHAWVTYASQVVTDDERVVQGFTLIFQS